MNSEQINQTLTDYHWLLTTLKENYIGEIRVNVTAQGGIESSMPKAQGGTSDTVCDEVIRRDKANKWLETIVSKVEYVQTRIHLVTDKTHAEVLALILSGDKTTDIAKKVGLTVYRVNQIKGLIVDKFHSYADGKLLGNLQSSNL